jgi:hypothetical protein
MTKGQIAITIGRVRLLDSNKATQTQTASAFGVSQSALSQAEVILKYAPGLADQVLFSKSETFDGAYSKARALKAEAETNEEKMERLRNEAPDLADLSGISIDDAIAKLDRRFRLVRKTMGAA